MGLDLNMNMMNQVVKGIAIYEEQETVESVCLIIKGRILVRRKGMCTILGSGNFFGVSDIYSGKHTVTYTAFDNAVVYPFSVKEAEGAAGIIEKNKDYGGLMVVSLNRYIRELYGIMTALSNESDQLYTFLKDYYDLYQNEAAKEGMEAIAISGIESLKEYEESSILDIHKAEYYSECAGIAIEAQKAFYSNNTICLYHIEEQTELARQLILECSEIAEYLYNNLNKLYTDGVDCLFKRVSWLIIELRKKEGIPTSELVDSIDRMVEKINVIDMLFEKKAGKQLDINREELENLYYIILSGETPQEEMGSSVKDKIASLTGSLDIILDTGNIEQDKRDELKELLQSYQSMRDKYAADDVSRRLRKDLARIFYEVYKAVFLASYNKKQCTLAVDLFLKYGFLDETLMREEQLEELVELKDINKKEGPCKVYDMKQWLTLIYLGKRLPSKNEFDMDYEEHIRSRRKSNEITEEEKNKALYDLTARLDYEIKNMFQYNCRLASGQMGAFVPFLQESSFISGIKKTLLTSDIINSAVEEIIAIDYSIFSREVFYDNEELEIKREYVIKEVYPEIILLPIYGENAIMWQEICGRKKDSPGRFLLPIFTVKKMDEILVKVFGRFHWEICRTVQGATWNNIKYKSLTSEYMDYIQFYRKNRDLSEEKKEKLKLQIQKSRNNSREVFAMDYEIWIKGEAKGAIRLNKIVREMLATYCPFAFQIRDGIKNQPIFAEAMNRYNLEKAAKIRMIELRLRALEKDGKKVPEEILSTLEYYRDR